MNKELKDCTAEELEARFDEIFYKEDYELEWDGDQLVDWDNYAAIDEELGKR